MPYARPTLTALRNQSLQDITTSGVPGLDGLLRNAVLRVMSWVMSGLAYALYGFLDWISLQAVPFTATDEFLFAWAGLVGVLQKDATSASGSAQFSGTLDKVLPEGTPLMRVDGVPYVTTADGTVDATGYVTVPITASVTGAVTNSPAGVSISIAAPVDGINSGGQITADCVGGADMETQDEVRTRMLQRYAAPPQGGAQTDYIEWALAVPGVTRAWCKPNGAGTGTVVVYVMLDDANAANDGFPIGTDGVANDEPRAAPATGDQLDVANALYPLQPVTALVYVCAPTPFGVDITLTDLTPNTEEMQQQIQASLNDAFLQIGEVGPSIVYPSELYQAILATPGIGTFTMSEPAGEVAVPAGGLPVLGNFNATA